MNSVISPIWLNIAIELARLQQDHRRDTRQSAAGFGLTQSYRFPGDARHDDGDRTAALQGHFHRFWHDAGGTSQAHEPDDGTDAGTDYGTMRA